MVKSEKKNRRTSCESRQRWCPIAGSSTQHLGLIHELTEGDSSFLLPLSLNFSLLLLSRGITPLSRGWTLPQLNERGRCTVGNHTWCGNAPNNFLEFLVPPSACPSHFIPTSHSARDPCAFPERKSYAWNPCRFFLGSRNL